MRSTQLIPDQRWPNLSLRPPTSSDSNLVWTRSILAGRRAWDTSPSQVGTSEDVGLDSGARTDGTPPRPACSILLPDPGDSGSARQRRCRTRQSRAKGVRSQPVPVALVGECSMPLIFSATPPARTERRVDSAARAKWPARNVQRAAVPGPHKRSQQSCGPALEARISSTLRKMQWSR